MFSHFLVSSCSLLSGTGVKILDTLHGLVQKERDGPLASSGNRPAVAQIASVATCLRRSKAPKYSTSRPSFSSQSPLDLAVPMACRWMHRLPASIPHGKSVARIISTSSLVQLKEERLGSEMVEWGFPTGQVQSMANIPSSDKNEPKDFFSQSLSDISHRHLSACSHRDVSSGR